MWIDRSPPIERASALSYIIPQIFNVFEFGVSGSTTLDNGITVAVSAQVGRSSGGDTTECEELPCGGGTDIDEHHTTLSGSFGSLRIGRTESAAFNATVAAPGAGIGGMIGANYSWFTVTVPAVNTYSGIGVEDAMKVVYTTPNFNGLTIGASYAPNNSDASFTGRSTAGMGEHTAVGMTYSTEPLMHMAPVARVCHQMLRLRLGRGNG